MAKNRAKKILRILRNNFSLPSRPRTSRNLFQTLIRTVLSQATADKNTHRAFRNLSTRFPITPKALAKADVREIEKSIMVAGLYKNKSKVIRNLSCTILEDFDGSMEFIYSMSFEEARKILLHLRGVGPKTADVILLFCTDKPTIPIDTHVNRVSKRLGLVPPKAGYETTRQALQSLYTPKDYLPVHLLLISLGRKYCRARKPLCKPCPLNQLCPTKQMKN
ncbi:MAG: endonuclease III [Candidatus Bathyarchaeota archaeon]|nr:MAG: endonuclease III [Candidatus Bathyarchaeota archaeon]